MITTGIAPFLLLEYRESFPHPHNAYLEWLLDNGIVGAIPAFAFYFLILRYSNILFRADESKLCLSIGGVTIALTLALLIAGVGSQSFYPREGAVGMWCCIGLMLRTHVQFGQWKSAGKAEKEIDDSPSFWARKRKSRELNVHGY